MSEAYTGTNDNHNRLRPENLPTPHRPSSITRREIAMRNTSFFMVILYLQDIFWIIFSRIVQIYNEPMYIVSNFEWYIIFKFVFVSITISIVAVIVVRFIKPIHRIYLRRKMISSIIVVSIVISIVTVFILQSNARYVSGGLTGMVGVIYGTSQAINLASMVLIIRQSKLGAPLSSLLVLAFVISSALNVDGLATALTLGVFIFLLMDIKLFRPGRFVLFLSMASLLLWIGFNSKFAEIPDYLTPDFMVRWVTARFAIQAEQMYTYLAGKSIVGTEVTYYEIVWRSISNRFDLVLDRPFDVEYPRSVSEAFYYDISGTFDAGSSPGALLNTVLHGPVFFILPVIVFSFIFFQFFFNITTKLNLINVFAYSFLFKGIHANFSEYMTIISPTLMYVVFFLLSSLIEQKSMQTRRAQNVFSRRQTTG